jgi:hypothetical protein
MIQPLEYIDFNQSYFSSDGVFQEGGEQQYLARIVRLLCAQAV